MFSYASEHRCLLADVRTRWNITSGYDARQIWRKNEITLRWLSPSALLSFLSDQMSVENQKPPKLVQTSANKFKPQTTNWSHSPRHEIRAHQQLKKKNCVSCCYRLAACHEDFRYLHVCTNFNLLVLWIWTLCGTMKTLFLFTSNCVGKQI